MKRLFRLMLCKYRGMVHPKLYPYFDGFINIRDRKSAWLAIYIQERGGRGRFKGLARRKHFEEKGTEQ